MEQKYTHNQKVEAGRQLLLQRERQKISAMARKYALKKLEERYLEEYQLFRQEFMDQNPPRTERVDKVPEANLEWIGEGALSRRDERLRKIRRG